MIVSDLREKLVAVLGYGVEGKAVTAYLLKHGVKPVLFDERPWESWDEIEKSEIKKLEVNFIFGKDCLKELTGFDVAFRSPGIYFLNPDLQAAIKKGLKITSQTKWFFENSPAKIIGVTGTKGKGTTSSLIYEILLADKDLSSQKTEIRNRKLEIYLTGNIGKQQPFEIIDNINPDDWVVYELSSFQLQDLDKSPHIGVVLMVTSEHLDVHKNQEEYIEAKSAITKFQTKEDFSVSSADFENSAAIGLLGKGHKLTFSTLSRREEYKPADCYVENGVINFRNEKFFSVSDLQLRGSHNWQNVCAAILAASAAGCGHEPIRQALKEFKGLEHRLELVAEKSGVKFYNDSFSTTPETAIAAIKSFSEPLVLIMGGSSKNSDFTELGQVISGAKNIKALILIGEEAASIRKTLHKGDLKVLEGAKNMSEIFQQIKSAAVAGDVVLLSPACASFGMFKNYKDRGEKFKEEVFRQTFDN